MFGFGPEFIFKIPGLLIALTVHEYAHARAAVWLGDHTPKTEGRLTLNPIAHLDPFGLIMLCISNFGWAKPVNVNFYNLKNFRKGLFWVSLAGPFANFITAFLSCLIYVILDNTGLLSIELEKVLRISFLINLSLVVFNLLPIPPLDGSKILMSILPDKKAYFLERMEQYGVFILMLLVVTHIFDPIFDPLVRIMAIIIQVLVSLIVYYV
ncbi:MAG: site-2 protease family protein [Pelosinus sp.]|nr:site-2 protease family protein [Pelosinus sp.]